VTTIAAPSRRARPAPRTTARGPARTGPRAPGKTRAKSAPEAASRAAAKPFAVGRLGALLAVVTVFALVTAVVFHVVLAQNQMELDQLNVQIARAQRTYEQRRLITSLLASPERVIQEAEKLGLVQPPGPAQILYVPNAPLPHTDDGSTADTIRDWTKTKPSLGPRQP
jgi:cell division protein FtsL